MTADTMISDNHPSDADCHAAWDAVCRSPAVTIEAAVADERAERS